ncbi:hypothetical protein HZB02_01050 [Candidatus Woesearchaeota archaeon]|nr:hypothetical protein [Candidatus Woesearchaeota archaeon]
MKKGQITIFLVLGVVILILIGMLIFLTNSVNKAASDQRLQSSLTGGTRGNTLDVAMTTCMEQAFSDGLLLIGKQGGRIYASQMTGGYYDLGQLSQPSEPKYDYGQFVIPDGDGNEVPYGISWTAVSGVNNEFPDYPFSSSTPLPWNLAHANTHPNVYGNFPYSTFAPLCISDAENRWNREGAEQSCSGSYEASYDFSKFGFSIQSLLQKYIAQKTKECLQREMESGHIPEMKSLQTSKVTVTLGADDIKASLAIAISTTKTGQEQNTVFKKDLTKKVRLKKIHQFAAHIIHNETGNIFFDYHPKPSPPLSGFSYPEDLNDCGKRGDENCMKGMDIAVTPWSKVDAPEIHGSIITITDPASSLDGHAYTFQFAVQNRPPVLEFISTLNPNNKILPSPLAIDPDGDPLTYTLSNGACNAQVLPTTPFTTLQQSFSAGTYCLVVRDGQCQDWQEFVVST